MLSPRSRQSKCRQHLRVMITVAKVNHPVRAPDSINGNHSCVFRTWRQNRFPGGEGALLLPGVAVVAATVIDKPLPLMLLCSFILWGPSAYGQALNPSNLPGFILVIKLISSSVIPYLSKVTINILRPSTGSGLKPWPRSVDAMHCSAPTVFITSIIWAGSCLNSEARKAMKVHSMKAPFFASKIKSCLLKACEKNS